MSFVNLTPHQIKIVHSNGSVKVVEPSGNSLRVATSEPKLVSESDGVEFFSVEYGDLQLVKNSDKTAIGVALPALANDIYIVSGQCLEAIKLKYPEAKNFFVAPGDLIRDSNGQPVGCKGLKV